MLVFAIAIAGAAAVAVAIYTRMRQQSPETAQAVTRTIRELAAVVLVCSKAVEGIVDALQSGSRPRYATAGSDEWGGYRQPLIDTWEEE